MKHIASLLLFVLVICPANAQETQYISGKWVFSEVLNEKIDDASLAYLNAEVIDRWEFIFNADGTFETSMMEGQSNGTWTHDAETETITITDKQGDTQEFKILRSTENELALDLGTGKFLLKRVE